MRYCVVKNCLAWKEPNNTQHIKFFRFPNNPEMKKKWIEACGKKNVNAKTGTVCSLHFTEDDWRLKDRLLNTPIAKRLLNHEAVPTQLIHSDNTDTLSTNKTKRSNKRKTKKETVQESDLSSSKPQEESNIEIKEENIDHTYSSTTNVIYFSNLSKIEEQANDIEIKEENIDDVYSSTSNVIYISNLSNTEEQANDIEIKEENIDDVYSSTSNVTHFSNIEIKQENIDHTYSSTSNVNYFSSISKTEQSKSSKSYSSTSVGIQTDVDMECVRELKIMELEKTIKALERENVTVRKENSKLLNLERSMRHIFTDGQLRKLKSPNKKIKWSLDDITAAAPLYSISPCAYRFMYANEFPLPGPSTLRHWVKKMR